MFSSGGILITVRGHHIDSVAEPVMVVTVQNIQAVNIYYQVRILFFYKGGGH